MRKRIFSFIQLEILPGITEATAMRHGPIEHFTGLANCQCVYKTARHRV